MTRATVGIHPEAEAELEAAFDYLEEQVPGLEAARVLVGGLVEVER